MTAGFIFHYLGGSPRDTKSPSTACVTYNKQQNQSTRAFQFLSKVNAHTRQEVILAQ